MTATIKESVRGTLRQESESVGNIFEKLDMGAVEQLVEMLCSLEGRVVTAGCGTSGAAAKKIAHTLNCVDCPAVFISPADAVHGGMGTVCAGDVAILLSKGSPSWFPDSRSGARRSSRLRKMKTLNSRGKATSC